ncbi:hypothetical protein BG015_007577 [Linnemannia schmuckeri]|uniref:Yeast cell wall synthesis Kre9/Knh1-like N-terminal domain-containing protein n=1 Tax=Linnemannia schmuckeri TaxID=64567 RepID=A0A9P5VFR6_9FUNG|nr:hypothetical protein BG015_007577 [Linnemannia schmuckeri]
MKFTTLSAVLCLAATTVLADRESSVASSFTTNNHDLSIAASVADKREARHHEISGASAVKRADEPKGANRHEHQGKKGRKHNEHGLEAHSDGGSRYHDKGGEGNEKNGDGGEDTDGAGGDKTGGNAGDMKGGAGDKDASDMTGGEMDSAAGTSGGVATPATGGVAAPAPGGVVIPAPGGVAIPAPGGVAAPATGADDKQATITTPAAGEKDKKGGAAGATNPSVPRDYASPLWLVQPFGSSVWAQGVTYVISWGPNPDPVYAKALNSKTPVDILLMQGPHDNLKEVAVLSKGVDSSVHMFKWLVPTTVTPATDYSIRITHAGDVDTYSHYFEIVKAGDPRSSKSNVGEPLQMPQKGDMPQLNKGPIKPAPPPNPFPAPAASSKPVSPSAVAKPAAHASSAHSETHQGANMLAFAMTLFGAVYFL